MKRNKATILASGVDPDLRKLRRLQAVKSAHEKKLLKALNDIEDYWEKVFAAASADKAE